MKYVAKAYKGWYAVLRGDKVIKKKILYYTDALDLAARLNMEGKRDHIDIKNLLREEQNQPHSNHPFKVKREKFTAKDQKMKAFTKTVMPRGR